MKRVAALLLLIASACGRRETATPPSQTETRPAAVESSDVTGRAKRPAGGRAPVLWIGLDGLDWELVDRLAAEGRMPNWARLAGEGFSARLESEFPLISPILWTTAATGVSPEVHRVLDFQEVDPGSGAKLPISGFSRAVPAVWNRASAAGRKVGVVGWWASHPAEEVSGFFVSDHASPILFDRLPLSGVAYPSSLQAGVAQVVARDGRVTAEDLTPYLDLPPGEAAQSLASGAGIEDPVVALARILAATRVTQRIARDLYDRNAPDLLAVYFEGTDEVGHVFAPFTPPRTECPNVSEADVAKYARVVESYYAAMDRVLGQWMRRAEEDGAVLLVHSDHGFKWGADRPCELASGSWSTAAFWHRPEGALAIWGRGVRRGATRGKASLYDVAPTVLALLDLPATRRMPGATLAYAFTAPAAPPKSEDAPLVVRRVAATPASKEESSEYAKKLLALGYLSPGEARPLAPTGGDRPGMTEGAWNNLGMFYLQTRRDLPKAREAFEESLKLRPDYYSPMFNLAVLARDRGEFRSAEDWLFRALAALKSDPAPAVAGWAREYEKNGRLAPAASLLDRAANTYPESETIAREKALFLHRRKDCRGALAALSRFEASTADPRTLNDLALFETCLADRAAVIRLLERSLALKPDQPAVAQALERLRQP
jgi:predicted AlkP superfamily phosphohydrolase/phosphomutase/Flp pilus assembly protein TadD